MIEAVNFIHVNASTTIKISIQIYFHHTLYLNPHINIMFKIKYTALQMIEAVNFIGEYKKRREKVYVHCKV
jgi:hypothetical protein